MPLSAELVSTFNEASDRSGEATQSYHDSDAASVSTPISSSPLHTITPPPAPDKPRALAKLSTGELAGALYLARLGNRTR